MAGVGYEFGFVPLNGLREWFCLWSGGDFEGLEFFVALVKRPFGAGAESIDAVQGFGVGFRKQRVDAFGVGQFRFEAISTFDVPGGEDD